MRVEYTLASGEGDASQLARNCHLALALVRTTQKSRCVSTASGFLVSTPGVTDASNDENSHAVTIHGCSKDATTVHNVTHIDEGSVTEAQYFIKKLRTLGMRTELQ